MIGYNKNEVVGKMRERVILQNRIITQSDSGFQSEIYNDIGIYWSKIEYKTGFEEEDADKITNQQKINITLRYNILVNVNSRFVYRNELYQVEKVEYSDDRRFMTCVCVWRSSYTSIYAGSIFCSASLLAQSSLSAALMRVIKYQASLNAFGSVSADIALVQKVASSLNAFGTLTGDINFVQKAQASLLTSAIVSGDITIPKIFNASLLATGTTTADLTVTAAASLLLDLYPSAAAAYSLRKLRTAYTGSAVRVRRSSDNTEQDIGFDVNGNLNTTALLAFCGAGNGFVTTWYDQSGNARNATQTTQVNQPQIVSSGNVILQNSKSTIRWDGVTGKILKTASFTGGSVDSSFIVTTVNQQESAIMDGNSENNISFWTTPTRNAFRVYAGVIDVVTNIFYINTQSLITAIVNGTNSILKVNTTEVTNRYFGTNVRNGLSIGAIGDTFGALNGNIQEIIIYPSNQSSNRTGIQSNINTYYGIY